MAAVALMLIFLPLFWFLYSGGSQAASLTGYGDIILDPEMFKGTTNISTFLLNRTSGVLYLGARDVIMSVDTNNLNQQPQKIVWDVPENKRKSCMGKGKTQADCHNYIRLLEFLGDGRVYVCGTYAFEPQCAFLELLSFTLEKDENGAVKMEIGKGKCPFEPNQHYTAVMADGILYTAAATNFLGTLFDISRATGPEQNRVRNEHSTNWLNEPEFVSSAFIAQSPENNPTGDDDTIYFFFTEIAKEYELYTKVKVSRVARVCKSDVGGMKTLQRRWTTFLKAQLVCEDRVSGQRFNVLTDVFTKQHVPGDPGSTYFYALFTSQWEPEAVSAVCVFSLSDINRVMDGPFKEMKKNCDTFNSEPVPTPRPGRCLNNALKTDGFSSSLFLPDKVLTFVRDHLLMENSVNAAPLLVRKDIVYTTLAVTATESREGQRRAVLHLGTDHGELHRVAVVGQNASLLQEIPLFSPQEPVKDILLYQGRALVGSSLSLARVQAEGCALFTSCEVCAKARGLGCVWSATNKTCIVTRADPGESDFVDAALQKCGGQEGRCNPPVSELKVLIGLRVLLPCVQLSARPCSWEHPSQRHIKQHHSDLEVTVSEDSLGKYVCTCLEGGPEVREPTPCRRAAYFLTMDSVTGRHHALAGYVFSFWGALFFGAFLMYFATHWRRSVCESRQVAGNSASSEKGQNLLGSTVTPHSPSGTSLLSDGFSLTEKRNGTTTSTTATTLLSKQTVVAMETATTPPCNASNGHRNSLYSNCNTNGGGCKLASEIILPDMFDGRTGEQERQEKDEREAGEDYGMDEELGDGLREDMKGLEEELSRFPMFKSAAPLVQCEESSI